MAHGYAYANSLAALGATAFTWTPSVTTNRGFVNDGEMAKRFELTSASDISVVIDLGAAVAMTGFALLNHSAVVDSGNLSTWLMEIKGADDSGITTNVATPFASYLHHYAPDDKDHVCLFASTTRRYWKLNWQGAVAVTLKVGEIYGIAASGLTTITRLKLYGHGESEQYFVNTAKSDTGWSRSTFLAGPQRTKRLPFSELTLAERREVMAMWRRSRGGSNPLLWIENATIPVPDGGAQQCLYGRMQPSVGWSEGDYNLYAPTEFTIESLGREVGA